MNGKRNWSWLTVLCQGVVFTSVAGVISAGCLWCGFKLWCFYKQPPAPKKPDNSSSCPLERPAKKENIPEADAPGATEGSLIEGSQGTKKLDSIPDPSDFVPFHKALLKLKNRKSRIQENKDWIKEKEELIRKSSEITEYMQEEWKKLRKLGVSQEEIQKDSTYSIFIKHLDSQRKNRLAISILQDEIKKYEGQLPALEAAAQGPMTQYASSSSTRSNPICRIGSTGPSDSEIPRIEAGKD